MLQVDKENFAAEVLEAKGLVFVDFWSAKCEPCQALLPEVDAFAEKNAGRAKFCKLDAAANKRLAISQKVLGLPVLALYRDGEKVFSMEKDDIDLEVMQAKLDELA